MSSKILIIKLAADGDVLRTTSLLPALRQVSPDCRIVWMTEPSAAWLLEKNPLIDLIWSPPEKYVPALLANQFDVVINPDADSRSCALASLARSEDKRGFGLSPQGAPEPLSHAAQHWFDMGLWDDQKRANRRTYPQLLFDVAGLNALPPAPPNLFLADEELEQARRFLAAAGWRSAKGQCLVGINTGAGSRWPQKSLPVATLAELIRLLAADKSVTICLLGGPQEAARNRELADAFSGTVIDTGCHNPVRLFAALIAHTDVLFCADTLALHIGVALRRYVVAHFGPTSPWEIDLWGWGDRIVPEIDCLCCYTRRCAVTPTCSERLEPARLADSIREGISKVRKARADKDAVRRRRK